MKIRIRGNSIRYRLDKKDIQVLREQQQVEETTSIGPGVLHFCIKAKAADASIKLENSGVHLSLPKNRLEEWIDTDQIGFDLTLPNADGTSLYILVEKDFKCLTERDEDQSNAFDNPAEHC